MTQRHNCNLLDIINRSLAASFVCCQGPRRSSNGQLSSMPIDLESHTKSRDELQHRLIYRDPRYESSGSHDPFAQVVLLALLLRSKRNWIAVESLAPLDNLNSRVQIRYRHDLSVQTKS